MTLSFGLNDLILNELISLSASTKILGLACNCFFTILWLLLLDPQSSKQEFNKKYTKVFVFTVKMIISGEKNLWNVILLIGILIDYSFFHMNNVMQEHLLLYIYVTLLLVMSNLSSWSILKRSVLTSGSSSS